MEDCNVIPSQKTCHYHDTFEENLEDKADDDEEEVQEEEEERAAAEKPPNKEETNTKPAPFVKPTRPPSPTFSRQESSSSKPPTRAGIRNKMNRSKSHTPLRQRSRRAASGATGSVPETISTAQDGTDVSDARHDHLHFGGYYHPEWCVVDNDIEGRYANGFHVFFPEKMPSPTDSERGHHGVFIVRDVHPSGITHYSGSIVDEFYLEELVRKGSIPDEYALYTGILFKHPAVEPGSRVGTSAIVEHTFPCQTTEKHVKEYQANNSSNEREHARYWHYTLLLLDADLQNRVFSVEDFKINPHYSLPVPEMVTDLGMEVTHWHMMWRVAFDKASTLLTEKSDSDMASILRKFRKTKVSNP